MSVADEALKLVGTRFRHQGRTERGVDCVGLVKLAVERAFPDYPFSDREAYPHRPTKDFMLSVLRENFDETDQVEIGDFYIVSVGTNTCHIGVKVSDTHMVHAKAMGFKGRVIREPISQFKVIGGFTCRKQY